MFAAFAVEYADPPGLSSYGLQGPPPDVNGVLPYRSLVESRGSGKKWQYTTLSPITGRWSEETGVATDGSPLDTLTRTTLRSWDGSTLGTSPIDWQPEDGTLRIFATPASDFLDGLNRSNRGAVPPIWAEPGTIWEDDNGAPTAVLIKMMDAGGDWITLGTLNETANTYAPAIGDGTITAIKLATDAVETAKIKDLNVTTGKLADNAVTNGKLAQMAQSTIKGRAAGAGTGDPVDLTATQVTAILNAMVGDSGSGGTKGLVPAPGAGDAAASKFLAADGLWTAAGAFKVIGHVSGSNVANLSVAITGTWNYLLIFARILPSTNGANCLIRAYTSALTVLCDAVAASVNNNALLGGLRYTGTIHQPASTIRTSLIGDGTWYDNTSVFQATMANPAPVATNGVVDNVGALAASGNVSGDLMVLGA